DWLGAHDQFFVKLDMLAEERQNGTALTNNSTSLGTLSAHYSHDLSEGAVSANRDAEVRTARQKVRSEAPGAAAYAQWSATHWHFTGGAGVSRVEGYS